jgi:hypothetical protein
MHARLCKLCFTYMHVCIMSQANLILSTCFALASQAPAPLYMHACMHACNKDSAPFSMYTWINLGLHSQFHMYTICAYTHTPGLSTPTVINLFTYTHTYTHTCTHTYTHTHTHTHTHTDRPGHQRHHKSARAPAHRHRDHLTPLPPSRFQAASGQTRAGQIGGVGAVCDDAEQARVLQRA